MKAAHLSVSDLAAERGGRLVFSGLSLEARAGELIHITGANGAGKTTLLRLLAGLAAPAAGRIDWHDTPVCFIGHALAMNESLDVADNLVFAAQLSGIRPERARLQAALDRLGVGKLARRRYGSLSQGQKKRCSLARLWLTPESAAWLLDEPFVALDAATQALLGQLIETRVQEGGLVLLCSHQPVPSSLPIRELAL